MYTTTVARERVSSRSMVAYDTDDGELTYAGRAGTGMDDKTLKHLYETLKPLAIKKMALTMIPRE